MNSCVVLYGKGGGRGLAPTHNIMFKPYIKHIPCNIYIRAGKTLVYILCGRAVWNPRPIICMHGICYMCYTLC
jgi:hypothetical protein